MTVHVPYVVSPLDTRLREALDNDRWQEERDKRRLNKLYADARKAWVNGNRATFDSELGDLLPKLLLPQGEVSPEDDAQIRLAYGLDAKSMEALLARMKEAK